MLFNYKAIAESLNLKTAYHIQTAYHIHPFGFSSKEMEVPVSYFQNNIIIVIIYVVHNDCSYNICST